MKKYLLLITVTAPFFGRAQETNILNNEFSVSLGYGSGFNVAFPAKDYTNAPSFFPSSDSLSTLLKSYSSNYQPRRISAQYTHWLLDQSESSDVRYGIMGMVDLGDQLSLSDYWSDMQRETFDTLVSQQTGEYYILDSLHQSNYIANRSGVTLNVGGGFRILIPTQKRIEYTLGVDVSVGYSFLRTIEYTYYLSEGVASGDPQSEYWNGYRIGPTAYESEIRKSSTSNFTLRAQLPVGIRLGRYVSEDGTTELGRDRLVFQLIPGVYYTQVEDQSITRFSLVAAVSYSLKM